MFISTGNQSECYITLVLKYDTQLLKKKNSRCYVVFGRNQRSSGYNVQHCVQNSNSGLRWNYGDGSYDRMSVVNGKHTEIPRKQSALTSHQYITVTPRGEIKSASVQKLSTSEN